VEHNQDNWEFLNLRSTVTKHGTELSRLPSTQVTQIHYPRGGTDQQLCPDPPVQPRGEIHNFNPTAPAPQTPKTTTPDAQKQGEGSPLPLLTMGRPGVLPVMDTDP